MRELKNIKGSRFNKRRSGFNAGYLLALAIGIVVIAAIVLTVAKVKPKTLSTELTPGKIYLKEYQQKQKEAPDSESFTFYKSLEGKEGQIVPLSGNIPMTERKAETDAKPPQPDKILQIEEKIDKNIENMVKKENIYTVQVAALSSESTINEVVSKLKQLGYSPYLIREDDNNGKKLIKVRIGRFSSIVDAQAIANVLKQGGYDTYVITH